MRIGIAKLIVLGLIVLVCLSIVGCKNWEYDVERNGIYFKKISQSKAGTIIGYMTENRLIQGYPCEKGWIHFKPDWQLKSFQLSEGYSYKGTLLPAHTWIHLPHHEAQIGYVCSFPFDYMVQGYLCSGSGGYKGTHTGFYDDGKLRSFYPPEDVVVDGVPCKVSLFMNVKFFESGKIKSCKLADDYQADGRTFKKGKFIEFDSSGKIKGSHLHY